MSQKKKKKAKTYRSPRKPRLPLFLKSQRKGILVLEDGSVFEGYSFGAKSSLIGELVFHTAHTGYTEILTDPSYRKQILVFSAAHIGNQGVHPDDYESQKIWASGCIVRNYHEAQSHWRKKKSLDDLLKDHGIPGLFGVDTRRLILKIREEGCLWGCVSTDGKSRKKIIDDLKKQRSMRGLSLIQEVSAKSSSQWVMKSSPLIQGRLNSKPSLMRRVVVMDFGVKHQILRYLLDSGFEEVIRVPGSASAEEVLSLGPEAILLSNGPGDPAAETQVIEQIKKLIGKRPLFGICLGHQLLALALGLKTEKLKFGHHAANHPIQNTQTGKVEISSQNHGFAVLPDPERHDIQITHMNLNDHTVAGFRLDEQKVMGIQYHPESSPGPTDSLYLFEQFRTGKWGSHERA